jgi:hypothetical protein
MFSMLINLLLLLLQEMACISERLGRRLSRSIYIYMYVYMYIYTYIYMYEAGTRELKKLIWRRGRRKWRRRRNSVRRVDI